MPSNLYYFLVNVLHLFRFNFGAADTFEMGYIKGTDVMNQSDANVNYLSPLLLQSGYKHPLALNMFIFFILVLFLGLTTLLLYSYEVC